MKFPFIVKHNGKFYEPGQNVPIGQEPKKEIEIEDKTASELSKELKEVYGIDMAPQKGKKALLAELEKAKKKAELKASMTPNILKEEDPEEEDEELEDEEEEVEENEDDEELEDPEEEGSEDETLLDKIMNE